MNEEKDYNIDYSDKLNVETAIRIYKKELEKEIKKQEESIKTNKQEIQSLNDTLLKLTGIYHHEKQPILYDEKLKGIWENITGCLQ